MHPLNIILRRNEEEDALSLDIDGKTYEPVDIEDAIALVRQALIEAEEYLMRSGTRNPP